MMRSDAPQLPLRFLLFPLLAALIWSVNMIVTKMAAGVIAPAAIGFYRWALAGIVLTPFALPGVWSQRRQVLAHLPKFAVLGGLGMALYQGLAYVAAASTTATPTLGQGTVTAQCSALTPYTISLNAGANAGTANDVTTRRMKNTNAAVTANNYVGYQLYQDAAHTLVWGATTGTNTQAGIGTGLAVPYIVYGQILNLSTANAATGNYLDTVTATITY